MLMNGAINLMINNLRLIQYYDARKLNLIERFWSRNENKDSSIKSHMNKFLLHLPGDKKYISYCNKENYSIIDFKKKIIKRNSSYQLLLINFIKRFINNFLN